MWRNGLWWAKAQTIRLSIMSNTVSIVYFQLESPWQPTTGRSKPTHRSSQGIRCIISAFGRKRTQADWIAGFFCKIENYRGSSLTSNFQWNVVFTLQTQGDGWRRLSLVSRSWALTIALSTLRNLMSMLFTQGRGSLASPVNDRTC